MEGFDRHRVGVHAYTFQEGLLMTPPVEDGRRCLGLDEIGRRGFRRDKYGRWSDPSRSPAARLRRTPDATEAS